MNIIPTFKFGSKELVRFKEQHLMEEPYEFKYYEQHWYNSFQVTVTSLRKVWIKSGIQYIVDHGGFKTLETSIEHQQHTNSEVL